jgi:hypothetical protein
MDMSPSGPGIENYCADEDEQEFAPTDIFASTTSSVAANLHRCTCVALLIL